MTALRILNVNSNRMLNVSATQFIITRIVGCCFFYCQLASFPGDVSPLLKISLEISRLIT